jgi:hypothetical protein
MPGNTPGSQSLMVHLAHIGALIGLTGFAGRKAAFELMCRADEPLNWYNEEGDFACPPRPICKRATGRGSSGLQDRAIPSLAQASRWRRLQGPDGCIDAMCRGDMERFSDGIAPVKERSTCFPSTRLPPDLPSVRCGRMTIAHAFDGKGESRWSSRATGGLPRG